MKELKSSYKELSLRQSQADLEYFVFEHCWTLDVHEKPANRIKRIPKKPYLVELCQAYLTNDMLRIEKSRQMIVTWLFSAIDLWEAMYHFGTETFVQSKKEVDASALLERIWFVYENLEPHLQLPAIKKVKPMEIIFPTQKSIIRAIPQGGDQIRQYTCTVFRCEEMAFQEEAEDAYSASVPAIVGGGKGVFISTPNGENFFWELKDILAQDTDEGGRIKLFSLHFSVDEDATSRAMSAKKKLPKDQWEREYNLSYKTVAGDKVYPDFDEQKHVREFEIFSNVPMIRSFDFGLKPAAVWAQYKDNILYILHELNPEGIKTWDFRDLVIETSYEMENKYEMTWTYEDYCDIAGSYKSDKSIQTDIEIFNDRGIYPQYAFHGIYGGIELMRKLFFQDLIVIHPNCTTVIAALNGGYHFPEQKVGVQKPKVLLPFKDGKYDHLMDCIRYIGSNKITVFEKEQEKEKTHQQKVEDYIWAMDKMRSGQLKYWNGWNVSTGF